MSEGSGSTQTAFGVVLRDFEKQNALELYKSEIVRAIRAFEEQSHTAREVALQTLIESQVLGSHNTRRALEKRDRILREYVQRQGFILSRLTALEASQDGHARWYGEQARLRRELNDITHRGELEDVSRDIERESLRRTFGTVTFDDDSQPTSENRYVYVGQSTGFASRVRNPEPATQNIVLPPGTEMMSWARRIFSTKTRELVFEPMIADYQHEHVAALARGDEAELRAIALRYRYRFVIAFVIEAATAVCRIIRALKSSS